MKAIKIYLIIVSVLLVIAISAGVYVWYLVQKFDTVVGKTNTPTSTTTTERVTPETGDTSISNQTPATPATSPVTVTQEPIVVDVNTLPPSQKKILESLGYTGGSFTITPAMITCAEDAVGKSRLDEILGGSAPSPLETLKLLPCFKS